MGEHADDIINGDVDQFTGEWIGNGKGFPRSYEDLGSNKPNRRNAHLKKNIERIRNILKGAGIVVAKEDFIQYGHQFKTDTKCIIVVYHSKVVIQGQPDERITPELFN